MSPMRTLALGLMAVNALALFQRGALAEGPIPRAGTGSTFRLGGASGGSGVLSVSKVGLCGQTVDPCTEAFPRVDANTADICGVKTVALTFNDGPDCGDNAFNDGQCILGSTNTEKVLDVLKAYGVTATFFVNTHTRPSDLQFFGGPIAEEPTKQNTIRRIIDEGHLLASHSASHPYFSKLTADQIKFQLSSVEDVLANFTSAPVKCFRAPFGVPYDNKPVDPQAIQVVAPIVSQHAVHIGWTTTGQDFACPYDSQCVTEFYTSFFTGNYTGIVAMHAVYSSTVAALPGLIQQAQQGGYQFVNAEYYVRQKYGMSCADVVTAFNNCKVLNNNEVFQSRV